MLYDITTKDLCKYYPVYTKAGFIWKNRINWEVIQVAGNKVKTYFGIFTFLRAYKVDKVWYWVLTDGTNNITIKRDQARRNKKLPKTATVQTTLMLAQPKELIDQLVEQVKQLGEQYTMEDVSTVASGINQKITYISTNLQELQHPNKRNICKKIYRNLLFEYHPDRPHGSTELTLYIQRKFELWINRI